MVGRICSFVTSVICIGSTMWGSNFNFTFVHNTFIIHLVPHWISLENFKKYWCLGPRGSKAVVLPRWFSHTANFENHCVKIPLQWSCSYRTLKQYVIVRMSGHVRQEKLPLSFRGDHGLPKLIEASCQLIRTLSQVVIVCQWKLSHFVPDMLFYIQWYIKTMSLPKLRM